MSTQWRRRDGWLLAASLLLLLLLSPAAARACDFQGATVSGTLTGLLLETTEHVTVRADVREAHAREVGTLSDHCGTLTDLGSVLRVHAVSRIPMDPATHDLGIGPISGAFSTDTSAGGLLLGSLDFRPTNSGVTDCNGGPCPFAWVAGTWTIASPTPLVGAFSGVALIPFPCSLGLGWCYLDPTGTVGPPSTPTPIRPEAMTRRRWPEATLVITLYR
jgi:hypothetical protein